MSLFVKAIATCARCGASRELKLSASINAQRRPDLRGEILDGTFQFFRCEKCSAPLRLPVHLSYLDIGRNQWFLAEGIEEVSRWRDVENEARALFDKTYGSRAPASARELGADLRARLVFGWTALREALICDDLDLDPVVLELLKLAIIRNLRDSPMAETTELRLTGGDNTELCFAWVDGACEESLASLPVERALYDAIVMDPVPWEELADELEGKLFVDLRRLMFA
jgi:hypothetical protein